MFSQTVDLSFAAAEAAAKEAAEARQTAETKVAAVTASAARVLPQRFEYRIVRVECNDRADVAVQKDAEAVLNDMAALGWRLHTYSHVGLGSGIGMALTSHNMTNSLSLVFEREVG